MLRLASKRLLQQLAAAVSRIEEADAGHKGAPGVRQADGWERRQAAAGGGDRAPSAWLRAALHSSMPC